MLNVMLEHQCIVNALSSGHVNIILRLKRKKRITKHNSDISSKGTSSITKHAINTNAVLHCVCPSELKCCVLKTSFQMSWNTMMEGFRRHEGETGQNPIEMAKQQNDEIKKTLMETVGANDDTLEQRLEQLRKENDAKEKELQAKKREIRDRENFYKDNAPHHVQQQLPRVFDADKSEPKIVEIED